MDFWPSFITAPSSISGGVDDPYIEAKGETGDDSARPRFSAERMTPFKLSWKAMPLAEYKYLEELFYPQHRAVEFLWQHPSQGKTYVVRFVSSPVSSSEDGTAPFVASVEVQLQPLSLSPDSQAQPSIDDLMRTINEGADRAVDAATSAADSRDKAAASATAAKKSETAAAASAKSAETSASTATSKASEAAESAVTAGTKAGEASASAAAAKASETAATASEASAAASATTATDKADEAATSATTASTKAGEASASAATAKTSETNAASSAGAAATSASTASTKASAAATSATKAKTSETNAASSATDAAGSAGTATAKAEEAAASAVTATTKAGEAATSAGTASAKSSDAAKSATAAKASETNALASKNAAGISATAAVNAQKAAEAARDEAQDLANVGYASESRAGLAKVDGKTTQAAADGAITVKDVAIGGNLEDLASARGQIGDYRTKLPAGTDLNDIISSGTYIVYSGNCTNVPMNGMDGYYVLRVLGFAKNPIAAVHKIYSLMGTAGPYWSRLRISDGTWQPWQQLVQTNYIGDGIKISRSKALADGTGGLCIISVPEMQGATISAAGTSGLVPPAAAGQQESFLTGGGEYKPALTKISDSVNLADSKTAASAKAVKAAYERGTAGVTAANGKLSLSGGVMSGRIGGLRGNYNADASSRYVTGALEIRENGGVGNAQSDIAYAPTIGFHWANRVAGLLALRSDGIFSFLKQNGSRAVVDCDVPYATAANKLRREGGVDTSWWWSGQGGQPGWLWGGNDGVNMYVYNPANFSVNYANSCNYANGAEYANNAGSVVGTPNINVNNNGFNTLPPGGTWRLIQSDGSGFLQIKGEYAGGTYVGYSKFMYIRIA